MNTGDPITGTVFRSIRETSKATGLSMYYLRQLKRQGKLPHVLSGNRVMIDIPALLCQIRNQARCD